MRNLMPRRRFGALAGIGALCATAGIAVAARAAPDRSKATRIELLDHLSPDTPGWVPPPRSYFEENHLLIYYGNPLSDRMGILGEHPRDELLRILQRQATGYQPLAGDKKILLALDVIYAVAQERPQRDGSYLLHMADEMIEDFISYTRDQGMLFFIDLQNGRNDPVKEVQDVKHWLRHEHVHLAVDPEFTMAPGREPGIHFGSIDGEVVNAIQDVLQEVAIDARVSNKIMLLYQFIPDMIKRKELISNRDRVDLVIVMDGFGSPAAKLSKYEAHVKLEPVEYAGVKLFYRQDVPVMSEADIMGLDPRPHVIMYQ